MATTNDNTIAMSNIRPLEPRQFISIYPVAPRLEEVPTLVDSRTQERVFTYFNSSILILLDNSFPICFCLNVTQS